MTTEKEERPRLKIELSLTDKFLEASGWILLIILWTFLIMRYYGIPETFSSNDYLTANSENSETLLLDLILPVTGSLLYAGMSVLNKFPHNFNFPTRITAQNAPRQYTIATKLIRYLKFMVVLTFSLIVFLTFWTANNHATLPVVWVVPVFIALFYIPMGYGIVRLFKTS
jgi:hypothetical protein